MWSDSMLQQGGSQQRSGKSVPTRAEIPCRLGRLGVCSRPVNHFKRCDRLLPASAWLWTASAVVVLVAAGGEFQAQDRPSPYAPADIQYGSRVYAAQCAVCHGANGDLVAGVNLRNGPIRRASSDFELIELITSGIP